MISNVIPEAERSEAVRNPWPRFAESLDSGLARDARAPE